MMGMLTLRFLCTIQVWSLETAFWLEMQVWEFWAYIVMEAVGHGNGIMEETMDWEDRKTLLFHPYFF